MPRGNRFLEGVGVLEGLGLSTRQARVYLALLKTGNTRARVLSGLACIDRQDVYRLLGELERLGLVKRCLSFPTRFVALPIAEGTGLLIERRMVELNELTGRAIGLTKKLSQVMQPTQTEPLSFGVALEANGGKKYQAAIEKTQHRLQALMSWVQFRQLCFLFESALMAAVERGVTVELLTEKPPVHSLPDWVKATIVKHPNFKLKTTLEPPSAVLAVFDGAQAAVAFNPLSRLTKGPCLWTSHPALVAACQSLFWRRWDKCEFC